MSVNPFSLPLLQAVNNWQIGGSSKQKIARGAELLRQAALLPIEFRSCALMCFRQIALVKGSLWALADDLRLPETISGWTVSLEVARNLKRGVPPEGEYQGVIFAIAPPDGSVVINLSRIYRDNAFLNAVDANKHKLVRFGDGIGRYGNDQQEVVLQVSSVHISDVCELGGYSTSRKELAEMYFGREPNPEDLLLFDRLLAAANAELGGAWVGGDAKDRVLRRIQERMPELRAIKQIQDTLL
jgi:hypothetical protein